MKIWFCICNINTRGHTLSHITIIMIWYHSFLWKSNVCVFMCKLFSQTYIITTNVLLWVVVRQGIGMKIIICVMVHTFCNTKQVFWQQFWQWLDTFEIDTILIFLIVEAYGTLSSLSKKVFGMVITFFSKASKYC